jgi:hypothetical protein
MAMKTSDLMLDMSTGNASAEDVNIQEAYHKINVSSGIFEAACNISELEEEEVKCVQEAAAVAGLPTSKNEAIGTANGAVKEELSAYYDLIVSTAKKLKTTLDKNLKALAAVGKRYGISLDMQNFVGGFVQPLCKEMFREDRKFDLSSKRFIKGKYAARLAEDYGKGISDTMYAYDLSIDTVFGDEAIGLLIRRVSVTKKNTVKDMRDVAGLLSDGGKLLKSLDKVTADANYTERIVQKDVASLCYSIYSVYKIADAVINEASDTRAKKLSMHKLDELCKEASGGNKRISRSCDAINDGIKEWSKNLMDVEKNIEKAYTDSCYLLLEVSKKK